MSSLKPGCLLIKAEGDAPGFLNACAQVGVSAERFCSTDGVLFGYIPQKDLKTAKAAAAEKGCVLTVLEQDGVSYTLHRYRRRLGLIVWPLLLTGALLFSQCFAWAITVRGLDALDEKTILSAAEAAGLHWGCYLPSTDLTETARSILTTVPGVGYCAVNKIGSHVEIEINESAPIPLVLPSDPSSIFAAETGKIVYLEVYNGQETVKTGETVGKGQLIVSGVTESADGKTRFVHASASVIADAALSHSFTIPLTAAEQDDTGEREIRKSVELFGQKIPLYLPDGIKKALSPIGKLLKKAAGFLFSGPEEELQAEEAALLWKESETREPLRIFGISLPVGIVTTLREGYTEETRMRTEEDALPLLREAAAAWEAEELADGEILSREETMRVENGEATLTVDYLVRMDIALPKKIEVENSGQKKTEADASAEPKYDGNGA